MLLLVLCGQGEGGVKLRLGTGIIDLLGLDTRLAAACGMAEILESANETRAMRCARLLQSHSASLSC